MRSKSKTAPQPEVSGNIKSVPMISPALMSLPASHNPVSARCGKSAKLLQNRQ